MKTKVGRTSYDTAVEWTAVTISDERMNGLRLKAMKDRRSVAAMLDMILDKAGISLMSNEEFSKYQDGILAK